MSGDFPEQIKDLHRLTGSSEFKIGWKKKKNLENLSKIAKTERQIEKSTNYLKQSTHYLQGNSYAKSSLLNFLPFPVWIEF